MGRPRARFRLSLKDQASGESLKVELIPAPNESPFVSNPSAGRFRVRVNGKAAAKVKEATLTEVFNRLRHWLVRRARKTAQSSGRAPGGQDAKNSGSRE
ncbi:MAG: hypothetical protein Q8M02_02685 [Candidatus Didemnitutus sp.]|nr:hypothetical protein [Candidatus Didemnitutus sp.]